MASVSDQAWHQSSQRSSLLVMRWKSLESMPLAINLGAQLSIALCTRSSLAISCPFINILGMVQMNLTVPQAPERSGPVILSAAKDLAAGRERPFAEFTLERSEGLRVTRYDCSNGQEPFIHIEPCLK